MEEIYKQRKNYMIMKLFTPAWKSKNEERALRAVEKMTDQKKLVQVAKEARHWAARIAAAHKLVEFDLDEDLLIVLIRMLGNGLKHSESKTTKENAAEALMAFYRRYGKSKHGKEIRTYEGTYGGGYSDHTNYTSDYYSTCSSLSGEGGGCEEGGGHTDYHTDTRYSVNFDPKEA
jgi:hypothetical protein